MIGRKHPPHEAPSWIDPAQEVWFVTVCCTKRGENQLTQPTVSDALLESVRHRWKLGHWHPHVFLLMPDHCHALLSFAQDRAIGKTISDWKHWTCAQFGIEWQRDFFDHRLRTPASFAEKGDYIRENPVRAGLVQNSEDWPHVWRAPGIFTRLPRK